ncbi:MAG: glutamine--fructose-6-phosphate transaminase (isomerizing) [Rhodobacteraceae bacterium]|nr:glutamine--fructose-6-phosphate transaminase (isomerizing) [Paracoccaceae bacterium]
MCGIVGYLGHNEAAPILVEALRRLEYRGYDSAGIATVHNGTMHRRRAVGKLDNLSDLLVHNPIRGTIGIGHTRWATHGAATVENAHPQANSSVAVVHNGIIENWQALREELIAAGYTFLSETDTEVIPVLCQQGIDRGLEPHMAFRRAIDRLEGQYAICALFDHAAGTVFAARAGSPLAIGHGTGTMYVASDALGLAGLTEEITYLDDGDCAEVTSASLGILDRDGNPAERPRSHVVVDSTELHRQGFKHFMLKEIHEQPARIGDVITALKHDSTVRTAVDSIAKARQIRLIGCGTAYFASMVGTYWLEEMLRIPVHAEIASEFRYRDPVVDADSLTILISQSGETADTLAALAHVREQGGQTLALLNHASSTMARECDLALPIQARLEIGVASTKAYTCQLAMLHGLAVLSAVKRKTLTESTAQNHLKALARIPMLFNTVLDNAIPIADAARDIASYANALFIGRNQMYPTALEGALKLKEISYIHAEGLAAGELKHGSIALIEKSMPTVVLAPGGPLLHKVLSNVKEILARDGPVILITDAQGHHLMQDSARHIITLPDVPPHLAPLLYVLPLQLLAYHTATLKGTDVDMPRNLAKSVTVE